MSMGSLICSEIPIMPFANKTIKLVIRGNSVISQGYMVITRLKRGN